MNRTTAEDEFARFELERLQEMEARRLISPSDVETGMRAARVAAAALDDARAALEQAERDLSRTEVLAPFTGLVRAEQVDPGQFVSRGAPIQGRSTEDIVVLPRSAIRNGNQVLIVDDDDRLRFRTVSIARIYADVDRDIVSAEAVLGSVMADALPRILSGYRGVGFSLTGEQEARDESFTGLMNLIPIALLMIYALLAIPLRSYAQPLVIMSVIPFASVGAVIGFAPSSSRRSPPSPDSCRQIFNRYALPRT